MLGTCLQGRKSTQDEKGVAAKKAVELDDSLSGAAKQVSALSGKFQSCWTLL